MSDGDIQFPPGKRREAPKFEPPPWEREKFEELARARQAQEQQEPDRPADETPGPSEPAAKDEPAEEVSAPQAGASGEPVSARAPAATPDSPEAAGKQGVTEEQLALLLSGLRAEEPRASEAYVMVSMATGIVLAIIGLAVTTWGAIVLITPKEQGATTFLLVSGLLVPGLGFLGGGVWLVISTLRRQGVL